MGSGILDNINQYECIFHKWLRLFIDKMSLMFLLVPFILFFFWSSGSNFQLPTLVLSLAWLCLPFAFCFVLFIYIFIFLFIFIFPFLWGGLKATCACVYSRRVLKVTCRHKCHYFFSVLIIIIVVIVIIIIVLLLLYYYYYYYYHCYYYCRYYVIRFLRRPKKNTQKM